MITSAVGWISFDSGFSMFSSPNNSEQTKKILVWQIFPTCTKCLFAGRSYSTCTIKSVSSIWALVLLVTVKTTWGGMFGHCSSSRKSKGVGEGGMGHISSGVGVWTVFSLISLGGWYVWRLELSWNIRKDRTEEEGGGVVCDKSLPWGGGKDIFLTKLGAWGTTCYAYFSGHDCSDIVRLLNLIAFVLGNIICDMIL